MHLLVKRNFVVIKMHGTTLKKKSCKLLAHMIFSTNPYKCSAWSNLTGSRLFQSVVSII